MQDPFLTRNLVYGIQDSLVSTTGLIIGLAVGGTKREDVLRAGAILVLVEALSMAFGSFISEDSFMIQAKFAHDWTTIIKYAAIMFASYVAAGLIPVLPFLMDSEHAWVYSAGASMAALVVLMHWYQEKGKRSYKKTAFLASVAAGILAAGVLSGHALK